MTTKHVAVCETCKDETELADKLAHQGNVWTETPTWYLLQPTIREAATFHFCSYDCIRDFAQKQVDNFAALRNGKEAS